MEGVEAQRGRGSSILSNLRGRPAVKKKIKKKKYDKLETMGDDDGRILPVFETLHYESAREHCRWHRQKLKIIRKRKRKEKEKISIRTAAFSAKCSCQQNSHIFKLLSVWRGRGACSPPHTASQLQSGRVGLLLLLLLLGEEEAPERSLCWSYKHEQTVWLKGESGGVCVFARACMCLCVCVCARMCTCVEPDFSLFQSAKQTALKSG